MKKLYRFLVYLYKYIRRILFYFAKKFVRARRLRIICKSLEQPINDKVILYDAFTGLGVLDSPRAIFKCITKRSNFKDFTHVFAIINKRMAKPNIKEFAMLPNVKYVRLNGKKYVKYLFTSKYIISNSSLPNYYVRRDEQIYLNTWHGVPLKNMGYDRPIGQRISSTKNIVRNFINATHIIGANNYTIDRMFKSGYLLEGTYNGVIINEPLPRIDSLINTEKSYIYQKLKNEGFNTDKKIIVYAPT